jgi:LPXTG-motif cell wall-anchored protein
MRKLAFLCLALMLFVGMGFAQYSGTSGNTQQQPTTQAQPDPNAAQPSSPDATQPADQQGTADQAAPQEAGQELPQTASPLPLLGLLGLGSLVAGVVARKRK